MENPIKMDDLGVPYFRKPPYVKTDLLPDDSCISVIVLEFPHLVWFLLLEGKFEEIAKETSASHPTKCLQHLCDFFLH